MRDCYTGPSRIRRIDAASAWLSGSCRPWYGCFATTATFMVWFSFVVGTRLASTGSSHHRSDRMGWMYLPARRAAAVGATVGAGPRPRRRQTGLHRPGTPALGRRRSARGTGHVSELSLPLSTALVAPQCRATLHGIPDLRKRLRPVVLYGYALRTSLADGHGVVGVG